jgi:hypothetical protein
MFTFIKQYPSNLIDKRIVRYYNDIPKLQNILFWAAGGPGNGKTTFLNNMVHLIENDYNQNRHDMLIIGNSLANSLKLNSRIKSIASTSLAKHKLIIVDDHGADDDSINSINNFARKNNYLTVLFYPWTNYHIFCERLATKKNECGYELEYNLALFWSKHQYFNKKICQYVTYPHNCPFDIFLIYDNNYDHNKAIIHAKIMDKNYLFDKFFLNKIDGNIVMPSEYSMQTNIWSKKFIPKKELLTADLKIIMHYLFKDLTSETGADKQFKQFIHLNYHLKSLTTTINWML